MAIMIDKYIKPEYPEGKSYYVKLFGQLTVEKFPELTRIYFPNIPHQLELSKEDIARFLPIQKDVKEWLYENGLIKWEGNSIELVMDAKKKLESVISPKRNYFYSNTVSVPDTKNSPQLTETKSKSKSLWEITDHKLVSGLLLIIATVLITYIFRKYGVIG